MNRETTMKSSFEEALFAEIELFEDSRLKDAALYAHEGEAKRVRPLIALLIANQLDPSYANYHPMIALELAHTSSLILDDLPVMDNSTQRRNKPSLHVAFNEQEAILTAVGLISESYKQLHKAVEKIVDLKPKNELLHILMDALQTTAMAGGLCGAPIGQWMDLTIDRNFVVDLQVMMQKKTGVFFESAFVLGWLFGGGDRKKIDQVKLAAKSFGVIFQIVDDFLDYADDLKERPRANYVIQNGVKSSIDLLEKEKERLEALFDELGLTKLLKALLEPLESRLLAIQPIPCY